MKPQDHATYEKIMNYLQSSGAPKDIINGVAKINEEKLTDEVTEIPNHKFLNDRLEEEYANCKRYGRSLSIIMLDLDDFKKVNDTYGHKAGDETLRFVAGYIKNELRSGDAIGRYGGEEFLAIFPHTHEEEAYTIAERMRKGIEKQSIRVKDNEGKEKDINITVSIGVSELNGKREESSLEETIRKADGALYDSKREGKNRVKTA